MYRRTRRLPLALLLVASPASLPAADRVAAGVAAPALVNDGVVPGDTRPWADVRRDTLRVVWSVVNESHFDETFGGVDWRAAGERAREQLPAIEDNEQLRQVLQSMLGELGQSHFAILPREAAVFQPAERTRIGTTGVELAWVDGEVVVAGVRTDSAAARAGVKIGTKLRRVAGIDLREVAEAMRRMAIEDAERSRTLTGLARARLAAAVGSSIALLGEDARGMPIELEVPSEAHDGPWSEPLGNLPSVPLRCESRREDDGTAYLRFNVFAPALMKPLRTFLRGLQPGDALVVDLRGNPGGVSDMASGIAGLLIDRELVLGEMRLRSGRMKFVAYPQERAFRGPVAILIDGQSASTSEILAAGLRDQGRVRLFGECTAGAALPSAFRALPNGDLLQYAIADLRTPNGRMIEGQGVEPDVSVRRTVEEIAGGRDTVLEAAVSWLTEARQRARRAGAESTQR